MGILGFSSLRDTMRKAKDRLAELNRAIEAAEAELERVAGLPLPFADFVAWQLEQLDAKGHAFFGFLRALMSNKEASFHQFVHPLVGRRSLADFQATYNMDLTSTLLNCRNRGEVIDPDVFWIAFRGQIKAALREALENSCLATWPKECGLPRAERVELLRNLEGRLQALRDERDELDAELATSVA